MMTEAKKTLKKDPILGKVIATVTLPKIIFRSCLFQEICRTLVYQQLSIKAGDAIYSRFYHLLKNEQYTPEDVLKHDVSDLRQCGLSGQKASYILNTAQFFKDKNHTIDHWKTKERKEVYDSLISIKGIGPWTAKITLLSALEDPDIFVIEDLTLRNVVTHLYSLDAADKNLNKNIQAISEKWRPFRSVASRYLWAWKDQK